jgi:hypothetical protein
MRLAGRVAGGSRSERHWRGARFRDACGGAVAAKARVAAALVALALLTSLLAIASPGGVSAGPATARAGDLDAYATFASGSAALRIGQVTSLAERPQGEGSATFETWGSPGPPAPTAGGSEAVASVAASRDGTQAWAVGPGPAGARPTLRRFDAAGWRRCADDPAGDSHSDAPAACAGLSRLSAQGLVIAAVATVPTSGDGFEAMAVGWSPPQPGEPAVAVKAAIARYRAGRWRLEEAPSDPVLGLRYQLRSVVFTSAGDGWAYGQAADGLRNPVMLRFREGRWVHCEASPACEGGGVLPEWNFEAPTAGSALSVAGGRVFLSGTRIKANARLPEKLYPVILSKGEGAWGASHGFDPAGPGKSPAPSDEGRVDSFAVGAGPDGQLDGWARTAPAEGGASTGTLRLSGDRWLPWSPHARYDALRDHPVGGRLWPAADANGSGAGAVMTTPDGPLLRFDAGEDRWRVLSAPFDPSGANPAVAADVQAVAPDGRGGLWIVQDGGSKGPFFHRYTDRPHLPVFSDAPHPLAGRRIHGVSAGEDGTLWVAGGGGALARHDRLTGWRTIPVPGDEAGDGPEPAFTAVDAGPGDSAVAVGEAGRIVSLWPGPAARREPWCDGEGPDACRVALRAVDVAPDGSALVAGADRTLLWRAAGGRFHRVEPPPAKASDALTAVALPAPDQAWVATSGGEVFAGRRGSAGWTWSPSPENAELEPSRPLRALAVTPRGEGIAVGDGGTVLERTPGEAGAWRRTDLGVSHDLTAVALAPDGGAALIGAEGGAIWTRRDGQYRLARPDGSVDRYTAGGDTRVSALALAPGVRDGQVEAWAALEGRDLGGVLLHHASDPGEPLLDPTRGAEPLRDAPPARPGEVSFLAFGKSDCANSSFDPCPGPSGTDALSDVVSREIVARARDLAGDGRRPGFAVFTGDANDHGGNLSAISRPAMLNEWVDLVARPLDALAVPVLGAIGVLDLTESAKCVERNLGVCVDSEQATQAGANLFWRQAMAGRVGQDGGPQAFGDLRYRPVRDDLAPPAPDAALPGGAPDPVPSKVPAGGARTHYAVDVVRDGRAVLRLVVVDNSLGSLRASDPVQQPPEPRGQLAWLDRVLVARPPGLPAVVVATAPTYSYRPRTASDLADDGASLERVVLRHRVSAVVSGRLGWNGLYYALAPGVHCPAPGGVYPQHPPTARDGCGRASGLPGPDAAVAGAGDAVPFVVSSSAGGKLAQAGGDGYWHGYSVVRVDASGDPAKTIVEQRPILDWVVLTAPRQRLLPGRSLRLTGVGREPLSADTPARYHRLDDPSITHRYELLLADPQRPWLPLRDDDGGYVTMAERHPRCSVGCIDGQTAEVTAGEGTDGRVYALAHLTVGDRAATYPLVFEPGAVEPAAAPAVAAPSGRPPARPSMTGEGAGPPSAQGRSFAFSSVDPPAPLGLPSPPPAGRPPSAPSPGPTPEPPPARPPSSLDLARAPPGAPDVPRVSLLPPAPPSAQPEPKVNRHYEEAAGEAGMAAVVEDDSPLAADEAVAQQQSRYEVELALEPLPPRGAEATRRSPLRPDLPMRALARPDQPSAWARNALYGGGLALAALCLALGWSSIGRGPARAAPAFSRSRPDSRGRR